MTGKDWATVAIAIFGALTGIASLGWNIAVYLYRDRPRLTLSCAWGYPINMPPLDGTTFIQIIAANRTRHAVTVESMGLQLSNREQLLFFDGPKQQLPYEVKPGNSYTAWAPAVEIAEQVRAQGGRVTVVKVWANDAVGHRWQARIPTKLAQDLRNTR